MIKKSWIDLPDDDPRLDKPMTEHSPTIAEDFQPYDPKQLWNRMEPNLYAKFCATLENTGFIRAAADSVQVHVNHLQVYRADHPEFEIMLQDALERYRQMVVLIAQNRALHGTKRPILGGRERTKIVAYEVRHSDRLMELFLKKVDPQGFGTKSQVEVTEVRPAGINFARMSKRARKKLRALMEVLKAENADAEVVEDVANVGAAIEDE